MFLRIVNQVEEGIISLLLSSMTILVFVEVVLRFGFNTGIHWAQEATLHLSAWMVLFGASYGIRVGSHIGVEALVRVLNPKLRRIVSTFAVLASLVYCGLFIKGAYVYLKMVQSIGIELEDIAVKKWIAHSILLVGMVLLAIRLLILLYMIITGKVDSFQLMDEAKESMKLITEAKKDRDAEFGDEAAS